MYTFIYERNTHGMTDDNKNQLIIFIFKTYDYPIIDFPNYYRIGFFCERWTGYLSQLHPYIHWIRSKQLRAAIQKHNTVPIDKRLIRRNPHILNKVIHPSFIPRITVKYCIS